MPGDRKNPVDGTIIVTFGELQAEGTLAGLTVAKARELLLKQVQEFNGMPVDALGTILTMDPEADAWKQVATKEEETLMWLKKDWGMQMFQCVAKDVPDDYVIRKADICLKFRLRTE